MATEMTIKRLRSPRPSPRQRELPKGRIARLLGEAQPGPRYLIARVVQVLGVATALRLLDETLQLEANGGLLTRKGPPRRTRGGTFVFLARGWCGRGEPQRIFGRPGPKKRAAPSPSPPPPVPPVSLEEALASFPQQLLR